MVTNLKTGKKIRAFIYRMITIGALFVFIASSLMGREALSNLYREGLGTLTGEVYYLTEFREYISNLYQQGMLAYAGLGDDKGLELNTDAAKVIQKQIMDSFQDELDTTGRDLLYYIKHSGATTKIRSNITYPIFSEHDGHLLLPDNVLLCCYWNGEKKSLKFFSGATVLQEEHLNANAYSTFKYKPVTTLAEKTQLVLAFENDGKYSSAAMQNWATKAEWYQIQLISILSSAAIFLLFGLLSLISCKYGKEAKTDFAACSKKIWLEVKILLLFALILIWYANDLGHIMDDLDDRVWLTPYLWLYFPIGILASLLWIDLRIAGKEVFLNSIFVKLVLCIRDYVRSLPWQRRTLNFFIITLLSGIIALLVSIVMFRIAVFQSNMPYCSYSDSLATTLAMLSLVAFILGICLLLIAIRFYKFAKDCNAVTGKISELQRGDSSTPLLLPRRSLLKQAAMDLNELESGIENAVEQRNRSNRMRVELITNVSHDLKTPLTSIINYADLLCEEDLPEPASDYARALSGKAYRLKNMVQDVFDLSKATTGNLPVEKHRLDLVKLIKQTLADMDEKISGSTLSFKLNISEEPLMIEADGDKLYRVFQNLFVNAIQYSLEYSRVHIQLSALDGYAVAKIKNTSKGELDFEPSEIMERFVRSDSARTTEGSGLGLSIVQSFTESCDGTFTIETDADMFTACVCFPLSQEIIVCEPDSPTLSEEPKLSEETNSTELTD